MEKEWGHVCGWEGWIGKRFEYPKKTSEKGREAEDTKQ